MKSSIKLSALGSALALAGIFMVGGVAQAGTVTSSYDGINGKNINYTVVLPGNNATKAGPTTAGLFKFTQTGGTIDVLPVNDKQYVSFCIDLEDGISAGTYTWDVVSLAAAPDPNSGPMKAAKANDLAKLLGGVLGANLIDAKTILNSDEKKAALQMAVWEVVFESATTYNVTDGNAKFTDDNYNVVVSGLEALANTYLGGIANATAMQGLRGLTSPAVGISGVETQDFVVQVVPIPAAAWLFGSALMGVVALGRRRMKNGAQV
jgi:hypothetical protein